MDQEATQKAVAAARREFCCQITGDQSWVDPIIIRVFKFETADVGGGGEKRHVYADPHKARTRHGVCDRAENISMIDDLREVPAVYDKITGRCCLIEAGVLTSNDFVDLK